MYKKILVPVDGSAAANRGLDEAIRAAKAFGGALRLVHVANELILADDSSAGLSYATLSGAVREIGRRILAQAEEKARSQGVSAESELVEAIGGRTADFIVDRAKQWPADLIVMGTHGRRGLRRLALGSDAELVLRYAPGPVLFVREAPEAA
jgi:nucleotide-binding universal stress UspA family protein